VRHTAPQQNSRCTAEEALPYPVEAQRAQGTEGVVRLQELEVIHANSASILSIPACQPNSAMRGRVRGRGDMESRVCGNVDHLSKKSLDPYRNPVSTVLVRDVAPGTAGRKPQCAVSTILESLVLRAAFCGSRDLPALRSWSCPAGSRFLSDLSRGPASRDLTGSELNIGLVTTVAGSVESA
jgi:hypothetical protein